jgi:hypothetical protein
MTEISEAAHRRAVDLGMAETEISPDKSWAVTAFARYIQAVSDAAKASRDHGVTEEAWDALAPFIVPDPVDPLDEAWASANACSNPKEWMGELAKRGLEIRPVQP